MKTGFDSHTQSQKTKASNTARCLVSASYDLRTHRSSRERERRRRCMSTNGGIHLWVTQNQWPPSPRRPPPATKWPRPRSEWFMASIGCGGFRMRARSRARRKACVTESSKASSRLPSFFLRRRRRRRRRAVFLFLSQDDHPRAVWARRRPLEHHQGLVEPSTRTRRRAREGCGGAAAARRRSIGQQEQQWRMTGPRAYEPPS